MTPAVEIDEPIAPSADSKVFDRLHRRVIAQGLCTHCGTCVGLSGGQLSFEPTANGPLPRPLGEKPPALPDSAFGACPGRGQDYPQLSEFVFGSQPKNWLTGHVRACYQGYAKDERVRRQAASGGVTTQVLLHLLRTDRVQGAVVLRHGHPQPWLSSPIIAETEEQILSSAGSVYVPVPVNTLLDQMQDFRGRLAYVGLPDQVASLRRLQQLGHPGAAKVDYVVGPYVGTAIYLGAIESYLRAHRIDDLDRLAELRYREGEWPGYLYIRTTDGTELRAPKFYYNYLIPFYITNASLFSIDFTNELTDISVGDAWSPDLERAGGGHSVILARSRQGVELLEELGRQDLLVLASRPLEDTLSMHGHMLDFKKRGAFLRMGARRLLGQSTPEYGVKPATIPLSRVLVELVISGLFLVGRTRIARWLLQWIPLSIIGPVFDWLRVAWKRLSKPTKRAGLWSVPFTIDETAKGGME